jgi:4-hydroxybenzoate polyprenyltransferase
VGAELLVEIAERPARRSAAASIAALRPRQWTKNLLLFAGIVFAAELGDAGRWVQAPAAFVAYCAASSAAYLVNDVRDRDADRRHPIKRLRPVARGDLSIRAALVLAAGLVLAAFAIAALLGAGFVALLAAFAGLQLAYTLRLKRIVFVDACAIAALFVDRAAAGAVAVDVPVSAWLLTCTGLLALFLALCKRRGELALVESRGGSARAVLGAYALGWLDPLVTALGVATTLVYGAYTFAAHDAPLLPATVPLVAFGIFRYVYLVRRRGVGEEPDQVLVTDKPILVAVGLWVVACAAVLATA